MRTIIAIVLVLLAAGWLLTQFAPPAEPAPAPVSSGWRWTVDGWERSTWLSPQLSARGPAFPPWAVGLLQLGLSAMALVALSTPARRRQTGSEAEPPRPHAASHRRPRAGRLTRGHESAGVSL